MTEALIRLRKGQPLDRETFAFGSTVLFTYTVNPGKQQECEIAVDIYWFVASEGTWYIKFSISDDVKLFPGFHENSFVSHKQQTWHVDHGRHMLDEFERYSFAVDAHPNRSQSSPPTERGTRVIPIEYVRMPVVYCMVVQSTCNILISIMNDWPPSKQIQIYNPAVCDKQSDVKASRECRSTNCRASARASPFTNTRKRRTNTTCTYFWATCPHQAVKQLKIIQIHVRRSRTRCGRSNCQPHTWSG
jgi:hypothetical protein